MVRQFEAEIGAPLLPMDEVLLGQAAGLVVCSEEMQSAIVAGQEVDMDEVVRLASESRRILADPDKLE